MPVCLSDTQEGRRWLGNFLPDDQPAAARLLDALRFVSMDEFRAGLKQLMLDVAHQQAAVGPVALYPVRPVDKERTYTEPFPDRPYGPQDGSEHIAANLISEVSKTLERVDPVMALPKLDELRDRRVRTIVLVDDNIASGSTVRSYLDKWWENASIRSWRSYRLVKFLIVTYACSTRGYEVARGHRLVDEVSYVEFGADFASAQWTDGERARIRDVCRRYAVNKSLALGYKRSESLLIVGHTLPNNLPHILWEGKPVVHPWVGYFPAGHRRLTPEQQMTLAGYRTPADLDAIAEVLKHPGLREGRFGDARAAQRLLLLLAALTRPPRTDDWLLPTFNSTVFELRYLLATAWSLDLIDDHRRLTDTGHALLRHATSKIRHVRPSLKGSDDPYYPLSLRGVRAI